MGARSGSVVESAIVSDVIPRTVVGFSLRDFHVNAAGNEAWGKFAAYSVDDNALPGFKASVQRETQMRRSRSSRISIDQTLICLPL